jgi:hypothetical protein
MAILQWRAFWNLLVGMLITAAAITFGIRERRAAESAAGIQERWVVESATEKRPPANPIARREPSATPKAKAPAPADREAKVMAVFPESLKGFKGRLLGRISEVNAKGIVLANIQRVETETAGAFQGMTMTIEAAEGSPEHSLLGKTVQLLCEDNAYKKNYKAGQVIFGQVEWSAHEKALVIRGAQWQGGLR